MQVMFSLETVCTKRDHDKDKLCGTEADLDKLRSPSSHFPGTPEAQEDWNVVQSAKLCSECLDCQLGVWGEQGQVGKSFLLTAG